MPRESSRIIQLDLLRGVAILLVLGRHHFYAYKGVGLLTPGMRAWHTLGWTGVDLFFVLSGFLIGGLLFQEIHTHGSLNVGRFLARRALRIYPAYLLYLVWFVVWSAYFSANRAAHPSVSEAARSLLPNLVHLQNYLGSGCLHTWSLGVEEHFYLALPLLLIALLWRGGSEEAARSGAALRRMPLITLGIIALCIVLRVATNYALPFSLSTHVFPTHLRVDGLFFGVFLAYLSRFHPACRTWARERSAWLIAAGLLLISPMLVFSLTAHGRFVSTIGFTLLYLGYGSILFGLVNCPAESKFWGRFLNSPPVRLVAQIGFLSYPIYLWHQDFTNLRLTEKLIFLPSRTGLPVEVKFLWATVAWIAICMAASAVVMLLVERPSLALRDRLFPSRAGRRQESDAGRADRPASVEGLAQA